MKHALAAFFLTASAALGQPTLANSDDIAAAKDRANHTGTQAISTLSQSGATTGQSAVWNGAAWAAATVSGGSTNASDLTSGTVAIARGGTGAGTSGGALDNLGVPQGNRIGMSTAALFGSVKNVRMVTFGDSLVNEPPVNLSSTYTQAGGYCSADGSLAVSGTSSVGTDWAYPGGRQASLDSGATRRWGAYNVTAADTPFLRASQFKVYYVVGPGTLRLRSSTGTSTTFTDISGHTVIDTSVGTAGEIAVRTVSMANSNHYRIETVSDSGTVKVIGVEAIEQTTGNRGSYRVVNLGLGGSYDTSWVQTTQPNWTAMLTQINPQIVVFKAATFHITDDGTNFRTALDRMRFALPNAMFLLVGTHPWDEPGTLGIDGPDPAIDTKGLDEKLKAYALANSSQVVFADIRRYWPPFAKMAPLIQMVVTPATDIFTAEVHGFQTGEIVTLTNTGGALPAATPALAAATSYYIIRTSADGFKLATSYANALAGTFIDITGTGTGTNVINTGGNLISADGIHLTTGVGTTFQAMLLNPYLPTLVGPREVNTRLTTNIVNELSDVLGTVRSGYAKGPNWSVIGDLANANGSIGFFSTVGTAASYNSAATFLAFAAGASNFRVGGGYAFGNTATAHNIVSTTRNSHRLMMANFGNAETTLLRDPSGRLEVFGNGSTEPALTVSVPTGQSANAIEVRTAATLSTPGGVVAQIDATGQAQFVIRSFADDAAADADSTLLSGMFYRTTAGGRAVYRKP